VKREHEGNDSTVPDNMQLVACFELVSARVMRKSHQLVAALVAFLVVLELFVHGGQYFAPNKARKPTPPYVRSVVHKCDEQGMVPPQQLVPGVNFILYVISHDAKSFDVASRYCRCKPWAKVLEIPTTPFFESIIYKELLLKRQDEWQHMDFVGISTYRSLKFAPLDKLKTLLELSHHKPYDVAPLFTTGEYLQAQAVSGHTTQFTHTWDMLLRAQGYTELGIRAQDRAEVFLRNSMLIRPSWLKRLMQHMSEAMTLVTTNATLSAAFATDAHYQEAKYRKKTAQIVFKTPYYQWHPFIFERLPVFYLHNYNASIYGTLRETEWFDTRDSSTLFNGL
jgi:hypothetical protein